MPGLVATLDFAARPDLAARHHAQVQASRWLEHHPVDGWAAPDGRVALGRVDLGTFNPGPQPVASGDGRYHVCLQGDLYDRPQRLAALAARGVPLTGDDNADLLLATYVADGLDGVARLNGTYFFTLWDADAQVLVVGGDRYATRPHAYSFHEGRFLLAPDVRAVLAGRGDTPAVSLAAIAEFLALEYPLDDHTYFEGVHTFPGGTFLTVSERGAEWRTYWTPQYSGPDEAAPRPESEWLEEGTRLYRQAVERTLHGPVILPISGGTDSRSILAFAGGRQLPVYTFGTDTSEDVVIARQVCAALGLNHHLVRLRPDYLSTFAPQMSAWGEGMVSLFHGHDVDDMTQMPWKSGAMLAGMTAEYMRLDFADNVMMEPSRGFAHRLQLLARHAIDGLLPLSKIGSDDELHARMMGFVWTALKPHQARELLSEELAEVMLTQVPANLRTALDRANPPTQADKLMTYNVVQRQRRFSQHGSRIANAHYELRKPLDDYDLVDYVLTLPPATRRKFQTRVICHAHPQLASIPRTGSGVALNAGFATRGAAYATKLVKRYFKDSRVQSFANPQEALRTDSRAYFETILLDPGTLHNGFFNPKGVTELTRRHMAGEVDAATVLCALATIEMWRREHLAGAGDLRKTA